MEMMRKGDIKTPGEIVYMRDAVIEAGPADQPENERRFRSGKVGFVFGNGRDKCRDCRSTYCLGGSDRDAVKDKIEMSLKLELDEMAPMITCGNCKQHDHLTSDCDQPKKVLHHIFLCGICESDDHLSKDCFHRFSYRSKLRGNPTCIKYGDPHHRIRDCTAEDPKIRCVGNGCGS